MVKITDNTNKKVDFGDLIDGDFFLSLGELYIKTYELTNGYNCVRISDGEQCVKTKPARVMPVDVEIIITNSEGK